MTSSAATFESASFMSIGFCVEMCRKDDPLFDNTTFVGLQVSRKDRSFSMNITSSLLVETSQLFLLKDCTSSKPQGWGVLNKY